MPFKIPIDKERGNFSVRTQRRFELLLRNHVLEGLEFNRLRQWKRNFASDEQQYLAAHLLNSLIYRSDRMLESSCRHLLHMVLPNVLERQKKATWKSLEEFLKMIRNGDRSLKLRFLAVEGNLKEPNGKLVPVVAKSGSTMLRLFKRACDVPAGLVIHPGQIRTLSALEVQTLVIIDDCLGTGTQFKKFADAYDLGEQSMPRTVIYVPFVAHPEGIGELRRALPKVIVEPIEKLAPNCDFFAAMKDKPTVWARDRVNLVADVKAAYTSLLQSKGVTPESSFGLGLSLVFQNATPNNTLKAFYTEEGQWHHLFKR